MRQVNVDRAQRWEPGPEPSLATKYLVLAAIHAMEYPGGDLDIALDDEVCDGVRAWCSREALEAHPERMKMIESWLADVEEDLRKCGLPR